MPDFNRENPQPESLNEILESFEASVGAVRESLRAVSDKRMHAAWRMMKDDHEILRRPHLAVYRSILLNPGIIIEGSLVSTCDCSERWFNQATVQAEMNYLTFQSSKQSTVLAGRDELPA